VAPPPQLSLRDQQDQSGEHVRVHLGTRPEYGVGHDRGHDDPDAQGQPVNRAEFPGSHPDQDQQGQGDELVDDHDPHPATNRGDGPHPELAHPLLHDPVVSDGHEGVGVHVDEVVGRQEREPVAEVPPEIRVQHLGMGGRHCRQQSHQGKKPG
jgi:hypothetical protein